MLGQNGKKREDKQKSKRFLTSNTYEEKKQKTTSDRLDERGTGPQKCPNLRTQGRWTNRKFKKRTERNFMNDWGETRLLSSSKNDFRPAKYVPPEKNKRGGMSAKTG